MFQSLVENGSVAADAKKTGRMLAGWALAAACLMVAPGCGPKEQKLNPAAEHFVAARKALETGDKATALTELDAAIAAGPDVWMYVERAKLHADEGRDDQAKADVEAGLKLDAENGDLKWLDKELKKAKNRRFQGSAAEPPRSAK